MEFEGNQDQTPTYAEGDPQNPTPVQIQQSYFENLPEYDWVKYEKNNRNYLIQNVAFALFGSPNSEGELSLVPEGQEAELKGYSSRQKEQVMKVYEKLCEQCKYSQNDEDIYMSIILVVCARPKPGKFYQIQPKNSWVDLHQRNDIDIWCTAVFKIRKCIPTTVGAKSCRVFVDEHARVYQSWNSFLEENIYPKCVLIVPLNGEYEGVIVETEELCAVKLSVVPSPSLGIKEKVLSSVDTASTVASLGAMGVLGVSMFTPVAPVVLVGAAVATVTTGLYGLVRSSLHLHDRRTHEQTISPTDPEARGSWLNIAASTVGLAAGAASSMLSRSAAAGTNMTKRISPTDAEARGSWLNIAASSVGLASGAAGALVTQTVAAGHQTGQALAVSVEVLRRANLVTGGAGVFNSLIHMVVKYRKHQETPTKLELFQFTAATLFFMSAVMSNRTAQNIIEDAQAKTINGLKVFDKISAESRRVQGNIIGNTEVIQGIKNIADKDQFFSSVLRINKDVNQHKLRISMTADGQVNLNSQYKFNPSDLYNIGKQERGQLFSTLGPASGGPKNVPTRVTPSTTAVGRYIEEEEPNMMVGIHPGEILRLGTLLVRVSASGAENIAKLLEDLSQEAYSNLMTISLNLISSLLPGDIARLRLLSPDEDLVSQIVHFVFNYLKHERPLGYPSNTDSAIKMMLKEFFQDGMVRKETILYLKECLSVWIEDELNHRRQRYPNKVMVVCENCNGVRFA